MSRSSMLSFASGATLSAAVAVAALLVGFRGAAGDVSAWALTGFAAMALPVVASGTWLAGQQGTPGASFIFGLAAGLLVRATLLALVVAGAASSDAGALKGALLGLAIGFWPLTAFEIVWFARRVHTLRPQAAGPR